MAEIVVDLKSVVFIKFLDFPFFNKRLKMSSLSYIITQRFNLPMIWTYRSKRYHQSHETIETWKGSCEN